MRIDDEAVLIFLGELSGSADDDLIDLRLGPISAPITAGLDRKKSRAAKKSPAGAGLSLQEEPSNLTFTIDACDNSAADCTRDVMAITKMRFLQRRRAGRAGWNLCAATRYRLMKGAGLRPQDIAGHLPFPRHALRATSSSRG